MSAAQNCPECGTRVSAFAAGCAVCGADLEAYARRRRLAAEVAGPSDAPAKRELKLPDVGLSAVEAVLLAATAFLAVYVSVAGLLSAIIGAMHGHYEGRRGLLAAYAALGLVAAGIEIRALVAA